MKTIKGIAIVLLGLLVFSGATIRGGDPDPPSTYEDQYYDAQDRADEHYDNMVIRSALLFIELDAAPEYDPSEVDRLWSFDVLSPSAYTVEHGNFISSIYDMANETGYLVLSWEFLIADTWQYGTEEEFLLDLMDAIESVEEIVDNWYAPDGPLDAIDDVAQDVMNIESWMIAANYDWGLKDPEAFYNNCWIASMLVQSDIDNAQMAIDNWYMMIEMILMEEDPPEEEELPPLPPMP